MKKPLIGLIPSHDTDNDDIKMRPTYLRAVAAAGGIPVVLPLEPSDVDLAQLADTIDGVIFTGGPDMHPFYFGEETHAACGNISAARDKLELAFLPIVMAARKPVLGICRGVQTFNIALGGDIYQDLPGQFHEDFPIAHNQNFSYTLPSHTVEVVQDSLLAKITGKSVLKVNSMHHQAVRTIAPGLVATAFAPNRLAEAVEKPDYPFFLGVQWHPEYLYPTDESSSKIFSAFVSASCDH